MLDNTDQTLGPRDCARLRPGPSRPRLILAFFVARETHTSHPLLPLRVVLERDRGGALLASLLIFVGTFGIFLFLTYFFQVNLGYRPLTAALGFLPFSAGIIVTATLVSGLLNRLGPKPLLVTGTALGTAGLLLLSALHAGSTWLSGVLPAEIVMSIGLGMVFVAGHRQVTESVQLAAYLHGYRIAFIAGSSLLAVALIILIMSINAKRAPAASGS